MSPIGYTAGVAPVSMQKIKKTDTFQHNTTEKAGAA